MMTLQQQNISDNNFESCIKQGGPDGERYRLKKPLFYDEALKYCLNCKRCEVACPNDVRIGDIIQSARIKYSHHRPSLRDTMLANTDFVGTLSSTFAPLVNFTLGLKPVKLLMDATLGIDDHRTFPKYSSTRFETWYRRKAADTQRQFERQVSYFHGCYVNYNYPQLGKDFIKVFNAIGIGVSLLSKEKCCGVAKIANRCINEATRDARLNLESIREAVGNGNDVLLTSSTCCFTIRDEYAHILELDNSDVRDHVSLAMRTLYRLVDEERVKLVFRKDFHKRVAYHVPCHMEKLGWGIYSATLMKMIPGLEFLHLTPHCCGIAGTYGFKKENYAYSQAIGEPLFKELLDLRPDSVATDCETCKWQIEMSTGLPVENPISLIAQALDVEATMKANGVTIPPVAD